ncbi:IS481 family transposase [Methylobacterium nodulans]|uniref:IS481 family transposase n=1 Tax=Methylobacterium nodulans TaxID=114616 RepID=UPI0005C13438|nr:IS481 family transposase [Methylobacterium nodulans]
MPWQEVSVIDNRAEFVGLAQQEAANVAALCRRFGISRKTGYKWLGRARSGAGLDDRSRRPHASPARTSPEMEEAVLELRTAHPSWGGRKLRRRLQDQGQEVVPAASTITAVLARHARLGQPDAPSIPFTRFEHPRPNALWQMDFKGHFAHAGGRCHPLTVLDDHSRYALCLAACADEVTATVQGQLSATFRRYGLPERINLDNGSPWGNGPGQRYTPLTVWLLRLGIHISHSRPYHPQTNGKDERFHRTLKRDVLHGAFYASLAACQRAFDRFRLIYNSERPHEALGLAVPASRYQISRRAYPAELPAIEYDPTDQVRRVQRDGWISVRGQLVRVPKAFVGQPLALRPTQTDGRVDLVFITHRVGQIDLTQPTLRVQPVTHVSEHL